MRRQSLSILVGIALVSVLATTGVWAGNPHFIGKTELECNDSSLTVDGKIAGLGGEDQVDILVTATAECINPGGNHPQAANKESFSAAGTFPVQNGKALFELTVFADFQPDCSPPMTVVWSDVVVTDLTHGISQSLGDCP